MSKASLKKCLGLGLLLCVVLAVAWGMLNFYHPRGNGPIVLMYHHLAPAGTYDSTTEAENGAILPVENFEAQMQWLAENNYHTMLMSELEPYLLEKSQLPPKTVILTFDDGYESNYVYAYPILQKYGLTANIAVVVRDTQRRDENPDDVPYDPKTLRHLTFAQLKAMSDSGVWEIGSHSYDGHGQVNIDKKGGTKPFFMSKKYNTITETWETEEEYEARILQDLQKSRAVLEEKLGKPVHYLAYPYGRSNNKLVEAATTAGYTIAVTTTPGSISNHTDKMELPRYNIDRNLTMEEFGELITYEPKTQ